jgi:hypothetical protein
VIVENGVVSSPGPIGVTGGVLRCVMVLID